MGNLLNAAQGKAVTPWCGRGPSAERVFIHKGVDTWRLSFTVVGLSFVCHAWVSLGPWGRWSRGSHGPGSPKDEPRHSVREEQTLPHLSTKEAHKVITTLAYRRPGWGLGIAFLASGLTLLVGIPPSLCLKQPSVQWNVANNN